MERSEFDEWSRNMSNKFLNCTLIIPSHNRHEYLERIFDYYKDANFKVVCCDSSEKKYNKYIPENIKYYHFPNMNFKQKMFRTISDSDTEYIVCCADDDFIIKRAIQNGLDFLNQNVDYNSFVGNYLSYYRSFDGCFYQGSEKSSYIPSLGVQNIDSFMRNYYMILWSLYRKKDLLVAYDIMINTNFYNDNFIELIIGITLASKGKIKISNENWGIREIDLSGDHWGKRHVSLCLEDNVKLQNDIDSIKTASNDRILENAFEIGLNAYIDFCNSYMNISCRKKLKMFISKILRGFLSDKQFQKLKKIFAIKYSIKKPLYLRGNISDINSSESKNIEYDQKDLKDIEILVKKFNLSESLKSKVLNV